MTWKEFWGNGRRRTEFIISIIILLAVLESLSVFLNFVESRSGVTLSDPVLAAFHPVNFTWVIFLTIYGSLIAAVVMLIRDPERLLFTLQVYTLMVIVRIAAMYAVPLNPPLNTIPLADPFVQYFGSGAVLTKDLFFSGHTATLFILFLTASSKKVKYFFLAGTIAAAVLLLLQHVHYTVDVLSAPFFTYGCYRIVVLLKSKIAEAG